MLAHLEIVMWTEVEPLEFIKDYLSHLDESLKEEDPKKGLSRIQRLWLGFCLMGVLLTNSICWAKFERLSLASYSKQALSWMFCHSKISWDALLQHSIRIVLRKYGVKGGYLVLDDKDISRSKNAKKIYHLHKMKDKTTGGYLWGQNIVALYLVTSKISIPVGFSFYAPDPAQKEWREKRKELKKKGVNKSLWPKKPEPLSDYPKKYELAVHLCKDFKRHFPEMQIKAVLADNLYGHAPFIQGIQEVLGEIQIITKMRKNQNIRYWKKNRSCSKHFTSYGGWEQKVKIRNRENKTIIAGGGRLYVPSHKEKRFVIAMKYEGENDYRYLMATDLSWNMKEIIEAFSIRWLIEVFFEDWSGYHGFCSLAKQCGKEGSLRPLTLSLLFDHCFLFHPDQLNSFKSKTPLATFGSLAEKTRASAICYSVQKILEKDNPLEELKKLMDCLEDVYLLRESKKHLNETEDDFINSQAA